MHLTRKQAARFHFLFNRLMMFAHDALDIDGEVIDYGSQQLCQDIAAATAEELWSNRVLIDRFIAENPFRLGGHDLEAVRLWKSGLTDAFVVMEHTPAGSVFLGGNHAFCVKGITHGIEEMVPDPPSFVKTTLLPHEGAIVYAMQMIPVTIAYGPGMLALFDEWYVDALKDKPMITTAVEFIKAASKIEEERGITAINKLIDELERKSASEAGGAHPPEGFGGKADDNLDGNASH